MDENIFVVSKLVSVVFIFFIFFIISSGCFWMLVVFLFFNLCISIFFVMKYVKLFFFIDNECILVGLMMGNIGLNGFVFNVKFFGFFIIFFFFNYFFIIYDEDWGDYFF